MNLQYRCCAGLDVHRDSISACVRRIEGDSEVVIEEAVFGTFTRDLAALRKWLQERAVEQVAMESTGVYWMPVWNMLEGEGAPQLALRLVNPATVRALQGRKTDRIDARRIAEYLQYGLLRGSFVPSKQIRQLRDLTRLRVHLQQERNRVINRMARLLEIANIKLASVASNIVGKSGTSMLRLLAAGVEDPEQLADCALRKLRRKLPDLRLALEGRPDLHFRWMLQQLLNKLEALDTELACTDAQIEQSALPYTDVLRRLTAIPGVDLTTALVLIAELGVDMGQFPTASHLASWAGLCPGNQESAGKRFSGRTRPGDRYLRRILVQSAWAAARTQGCFLATVFFRIAQHRGLKKAAVAVAHRILLIVWHMLAEGVEYYELGADHLDRRHPERTAQRLTRRLQKLGFNVALTRTQRPARPVVDSSECRRCAQWGLPRCIHAVKPKAQPPAPS